MYNMAKYYIVRLTYNILRHMDDGPWRGGGRGDLNGQHFICRFMFRLASKPCQARPGSFKVHWAATRVQQSEHCGILCHCAAAANAVQQQADSVSCVRHGVVTLLMFKEVHMQ
jgi:hypothetical protein